MDRNFFARETETVARELLGSVLEKGGMKARVVETEAYLEADPASHAHPEKTERNSLMYETHGKIYVYICYGIHNMLNFTTERDSAGAVLIRAAEPVEGIEEMKQNRGIEEEEQLCNGPGKLCEALGIEREMNGQEIGESLEVEKSEERSEHETSPRIGISRAEDRELRYYIPDNEYVSDR